ncbi:MAG: flagellar biosynthesis protein FlhF [Bryobacterales bacterium]|jgi:flagellar biosynthesis protein FlhF|nr:flagellar biosynthesis protein FlhF [Bryobacterales bacterium]
MQTKTYFASSVPAALEVARKELGADAMLVSSRPAPLEMRGFGRLEVTFAFDPKPAEAPAPRHAPVPVVAPAAAPGAGRYGRSELDDIRQQLAALRDAVGHAGPAGPAASGFRDYVSAAGAALERAMDSHAPLVARLCANGLEQETARSIVTAAWRVPGDMQQALVDELSGRLRVTPFAEMKQGENRTLALMGPPGRGKTTTLVKIAVQYGLAKRVPVRIYSAGAHGIGGQEQMARYAAILGVPFHAFESLDSLHLALNGDGWRGLILIDTPGLSRSEGPEMAALAGFFARRPEMEKHLVLRSDARVADMIHMVSGFASLGPSHLLFTGLDEALALGSVPEVLLRTGMPTAFAGTGQQIPDHIEDANAARWARMICMGDPLAIAAAA